MTKNVIDDKKDKDEKAIHNNINKDKFMGHLYDSRD